MPKDLLGNPYQQSNPTLSLGSTLSINTPAPIIGTSGITYKPGKYTTLSNPGLANPYQRKPFGKTDTSLKKPSEMRMDRPKPLIPDAESDKMSKTTKYIIVGVVALVGIALLLKSK
jgi:hypothetical protein